MSIFLRGVDMPECCCGCPCCYEKADGSCFCTAVKDGEPCDIENLDQRLPNCPAEDVPEPHGRLIDADRLEDRIKNMVGKYDTAIPLNVVYRLIADAHPIIEAEEEQ
nr:hypothetical protein [uncultured Ruminococcus sp.]